MKNIVKISGLILLILSINLLDSCKKDKPTIPVITTAQVTEISTSSAVSGGTITDEGGAAVISRGVCWNTSDNPVIDNNKTSETGGSASFTSNLSQLNSSSTYYVRAYATNSAGTGYGNSITFKTLGDKPAATTVSATDVTTTSATLSGTANANSLTTKVSFEYGLNINYSNSIDAVQSPISGDLNGSVSVALTGLNPGSIYNFRIKAENALGITYSDNMNFTTLGGLATSTVQAATNINFNNAMLNGSVNPNFLSTTVAFQWGLTTSYSNYAEIPQSPLTGSTSTIVSYEITGLWESTTYHFRIETVNWWGTSWSDDRTFTTPAASTITDYDGNQYHQIGIGTQVWLKENLKVTHYSNGDAITHADSSVVWAGIVTGLYCVYNDEPSIASTYGNLYNWYAVTDSRNLCPLGWHVPTDSEWELFGTFLGGDYVAGGKMKEAGSNHWTGLNAGADNSSGFTALPGGRRLDSSPAYGNFGTDGFWWSSSENDATTSWSRDIYTTNAILIRTNMYNKSWGQSVRCLKN